MLVHLYTGSLGLVARSGVGQAVLHQKAMLESAGVTVTEDWRAHADAVLHPLLFHGRLTSPGT